MQFVFLFLTGGRVGIGKFYLPWIFVRLYKERDFNEKCYYIITRFLYELSEFYNFIIINTPMTIDINFIVFTIKEYMI